MTISNHIIPCTCTINSAKQLHINLATLQVVIIIDDHEHYIASLQNVGNLTLLTDIMVRLADKDVMTFTQGFILEVLRRAATDIFMMNIFNYMQCYKLVTLTTYIPQKLSHMSLHFFGQSRYTACLSCITIKQNLSKSIFVEEFLNFSYPLNIFAKFLTILSTLSKRF